MACLVRTRQRDERNGGFPAPRTSNMTGKISTTLLREKRRLCFVALAAFYAGLIFYSGVDLVLLGLPFPIFMALVYAVMTTVAALAVCAFAPRLADLIEPLALSRVCVAIYVFCNPLIGDAILASPLIMALLVVAGAIFIRRGMERVPVAA